MPRKLLTTTEIRAREEAREALEDKRRNALKLFLEGRNANISNASRTKLCADTSLPSTVSGNSVNDVLYNKYPGSQPSAYPNSEPLAVRVHHISEKYVILERLGVTRDVGNYGGRYRVSGGTGRYMKVPNKKEAHNSCLALKTYSLFRLCANGYIG